MRQIVESNAVLVQVMALYVTGDMNTVLSPAHQMEIKRYAYNHQVLSYIF